MIGERTSMDEQRCNKGDTAQKRAQRPKIKKRNTDLIFEKLINAC